MKDIVVIYHGHCHDGFSGAWVAWKKFGDRAEYIGIKFDDASALVADREVYLIDFVYSEKILEKLIASNKKVVVIDHHLSNQQRVEIVSEKLFDLKHSGAVLAWQYFFPQQPIPKLLQYVEDSDLWIFKLPQSKEITLALDLFDLEFDVWDKLANDLEQKESFQKIFEKGSIIMEHNNRLIKDLIKENADLVNFEGYQALVVNLPGTLDIHSALGHELSLKQPPLGIIWSERHGQKVFSLRSDGTVDVSQIAQKYGGGGHKAAAGFSLLADQPLPWKRV